MKRAGTVRVHTYTQLFAAARILSMDRMSRGDRLAIVTNGHGPGPLAADSAADRGVVLAELSPATQKALAALLPPSIACRNPVDVRGDATPARIAEAVDAVLADPQVDAVLALHVPRPPWPRPTPRAPWPPSRAARRSRFSARGWAPIDRREVEPGARGRRRRELLHPGNAVDAFSFLAAYRRNQEWLLEVPPPQPEPRRRISAASSASASMRRPPTARC